MFSLVVKRTSNFLSSFHVPRHASPFHHLPLPPLPQPLPPHLSSFHNLPPPPLPQPLPPHPSSVHNLPPQPLPPLPVCVVWDAHSLQIPKTYDPLLYPTNFFKKSIRYSLMVSLREHNLHFSTINVYAFANSREIDLKKMNILEWKDGVQYTDTKDCYAVTRHYILATIDQWIEKNSSGCVFLLSGNVDFVVKMRNLKERGYIIANAGLDKCRATELLDICHANIYFYDILQLNK